MNYKEYFKLKYRGEYYAEIKALVIKELWNKGFKCKEIAEIVFDDSTKTGMVSHYKNTRQVKHTMENWQEMIEKKLYPITKSKDTSIGHEGWYELEKREV